MSKTYDHKQIIQNIGIEDIDRAFFNWFNQKLNLHLLDKNGQKRKVPVIMVSPERWHFAREEGVRDDNGTIILPVLAISRIPPSSVNGGALGAVFADTKEDYVYAKEVNVKSSEIKNLLASRPYSVDPALPIYEVYTFPTPDHFKISYEVKIWTSYVREMNEILEKLGAQFDYKSVKSFAFSTEDGFYSVAFLSEDVNDESNTSDFSDQERIIKVGYTFDVPANILPKSNERENSFKRYFSQTKLVIKSEDVISEEEFKKLNEK